MKKVAKWTKEGDVKVYIDDQLVIDYRAPRQMGEKPRMKFFTKDLAIRLEALKQMR